MAINRRDFLSALAAGCIIPPAITSLTSSNLYAAKAKRPNVLWLIGEDMGLHLSCYGTTEIETPNLDRLARQGTRFDNAFCTSPICSPSRSSFNTGMYAASIGAHDHRTAKENQKKLPFGVKTITQWFSLAGYHSCLMSSPKEDFNFIPEGKTFQSRDWADRDDGQPFFCVCNFTEPHRWIWDDWDKLPKHIDPASVKLTPIYPDAPVMRQSCAKYFDFIMELDRKVGLILKRLEDEGLLDNTIIFFFGDNGRTIYRGKQWLYDEGLSVPLIARYPSVFEPGSIRKDLVSLIDIAPTSLNLAGANIPDSMQGQVVAGPDAEKRKYIYASRDLCDETRDTMRCIRDEQYKYIRNYMPQKGYEICGYTKSEHPEWTEAKKLFEQGKLTKEQSLMFADHKPVEELYDISMDPHETNNLAGNSEYDKVIRRLRNELDRWLIDINDQAVKGMKEN